MTEKIIGWVSDGLIVKQTFLAAWRMLSIIETRKQKSTAGFSNQYFKVSEVNTKFVLVESLESLLYSLTVDTFIRVVLHWIGLLFILLNTGC
jgi:hypothetical protein